MVMLVFMLVMVIDGDGLQDEPCVHPKHCTYPHALRRRASVSPPPWSLCCVHRLATNLPVHRKLQATLHARSVGGEAGEEVFVCVWGGG